MGLRLHNTLTRTKQDFVPIDRENVRMYVCGPTVYDFAHIGNARPLIVFDVLFRLLRHLYGPEHVTYVRNITDVDDKINARAAEEYPRLPLNDAIRAVTEKTTAQFHADVAALGCLPPTHEPRATEYVEREGASTDMIRLIADLIANGHAYVAEGHVLFDVPSMPDYGRLSNRTLDDMIAGARVEVAPYKKDPMDFVLWKPSKPGEPAWPSPWSMGRPGWHIECSAMAGALLGDTFDIHGGGIDLIFPHHENEIAQSRCAHGTAAMANYWLHNGFLQVEGEKMSKSAGNFVTIRELLNDWPGEVLRLNMLKTHYRQPIDWTVRGLEESMKTWSRWLGLNGLGPNAAVDPAVLEGLNDDLNTWESITRLEDLSRNAAGGDELALEHFVGSARFLGVIEQPQLTNHVFPAHGQSSTAVEEIRALARAFPSSQTVEELERFLAAKSTSFAWVRRLLDSMIELLHAASPSMSIWDLKERVDDLERLNALTKQRAAARRAKNFAEADRIRAELDAMGIALKDAKDPMTDELVTTWEVKR